MGVWQFIQDQVFGMKWLNELIGKGLSKLGLDVGERIGGSIQFFFYDVLKITVLLCLLIFVISYIQSYFPPERSKRILSRFHGVGANIISALLGTVTPFCSCSSIPLFIGFTSAGLPLGVTFSFLISSPMVDLGSLILLMSIFGAKVAVIYVIVGLMIAVAGGTLIEKLHMEPYVEEFVRAAGGVDIESPTLTKRERIQYAREQVISTFKKVFPYILVGVGIGAIIHNWIPESWIEAVLNSVYTRSGQNSTPNSNATNLHSSQKRCCSFCISSSNASPTFQVQKSIFHQMTKPIQVTVILPLLLAISFSRNDDIHSSISGISNDLIGVIPTIGQ